MPTSSGGVVYGQFVRPPVVYGVGNGEPTKQQDLFDFTSLNQHPYSSKNIIFFWNLDQHGKVVVVDYKVGIWITDFKNSGIQIFCYSYARLVLVLFNIDSLKTCPNEA